MPSSRGCSCNGRWLRAVTRCERPSMLRSSKLAPVFLPDPPESPLRVDIAAWHAHGRLTPEEADAKQRAAFDRSSHHVGWRWSRGDPFLRLEETPVTAKRRIVQMKLALAARPGRAASASASAAHCLTTTKSGCRVIPTRANGMSVTWPSICTLSTVTSPYMAGGAIGLEVKLCVRCHRPERQSRYRRCRCSMQRCLWFRPGRADIFQRAAVQRAVHVAYIALGIGHDVHAAVGTGDAVGYLEADAELCVADVEPAPPTPIHRSSPPLFQRAGFGSSHGQPGEDSRSAWRTTRHRPRRSFIQRQRPRVSFAGVKKDGARPSRGCRWAGRVGADPLRFERDDIHVHSDILGPQVHENANEAHQ